MNHAYAEKRVFIFPKQITEWPMAKPTIAVVGASSDRSKYGNKAVRAYARQGYEVFPIHPQADAIEGHRAYRSILDVPAAELDRISLYVPPKVGLQVIEEIARKPAREVWLNPGADSPELVAKARALGLNVVVGCSLVAIGADGAELGA
jgi:predicted CoA-binding protein